MRLCFIPIILSLALTIASASAASDVVSWSTNAIGGNEGTSTYLTLDRTTSSGTALDVYLSCPGLPGGASYGSTGDWQVIDTRNGNDALASVVHFSATETSVTFRADFKMDALRESTEQGKLHIDTAWYTFYTVGTNREFVASIADVHDVFSFSTGTPTITEGGIQTVTINRVNNTGLSMDLYLKDITGHTAGYGSLAGGGDYEFFDARNGNDALTRVITFGPTETSVSITIDTWTDTIIEGAEWGGLKIDDTMGPVDAGSAYPQCLLTIPSNNT